MSPGPNRLLHGPWLSALAVVFVVASVLLLGPSAEADRLVSPSEPMPLVAVATPRALRAAVLLGRAGRGPNSVATLEPGATILTPQRAKLDAYSSLALSPDGRLLAGLRGNRVVVRDLDARRDTFVTRRAGRWERLDIRGFRPDGGALLYTRGPQDGMDGPPPGREVPDAAYLYDLTTATETRMAFGSAFAEFADASAAFVIEEREGAGRTLVRRPLEGGEPVAVATSPNFTDFGQLVVHGREMAYLIGTHIARATLDGRALPDVTPTGTWAEFQWPRYSPSGRAVLYQHRGPGPQVACDLEVFTLATGERRKVAACPSGCLSDWLAEDRLIVLRDDVLSIVPLSGDEIEVARGVRTFVVAGSSYR
ncbi:MAG: hypothetical protein U0230_08010 [Polyangiales bacterium]